jgi:two-component system, NtrC family, response regulator AtoC
MRGSVLIVEDEVLLARNMARFLGHRGMEVVTAATMSAGIAQYENVRPDIVLVDHNLPDGDGIALIRQIRKLDAGVKVVMITAHGSIALAVEAMKAGADDYLIKPIALEELAVLAEQLLARVQLEHSIAYYRRREKERSGLDRIVGVSPALVAMKQRIAQILTMEARQKHGPPPPVLITGETGTGKELVARALHFDGPRRTAPFIEVNCAALPAHLVESELFGHERGAFTDAKERRAGLIQAAHTGTLFLDEIGEMPLPAQAKLLKVLEDHRVRPVGATRDREVDVRFVAATNISIEDRTRDGSFRPDLYYRLNSLTIEVPPLRERDGDPVLLAAHFLEDHCRRYGRTALQLVSAAEEKLRHHSWPGNVRELRNVLEQAALLTVGERIHAADLPLREPPPLVARDGGVGPDTADTTVTAETLAGAEAEMIAQALRRTNGNVSFAAQALGISRDTLRYRMDKHGMRREDFRQ